MIEAYDQGNVELTKRVLEITMAVILLASAFLLPRQQGMLADSKKVSEIQNNNGTQKVVVLDAGHGAADSGKVGVHGELEKDINLAITKKLQYYLEQENVKVVLTREDDSPLYSTTDSNKKMADMKARIEAIEEANPEIVVSIHQNSYTAESVSGPQVFYYTGSQKGEMLADTLQKRFDYVLGDQNRRSIK
ncbi:MAG: N-acetylmuramoyl-L-alanine amidase, partial [Lachnospiraceae bacterium]